jgi:hypothetical protein
VFNEPGTDEAVSYQQNHGIPCSDRLTYLDYDHQLKNRDNDEENKKKCHLFDPSDGT